MNDRAQEGTPASRLEHIAITTDDVKAFVTRAHEEGEIHPDLFVPTEKLSVGLHDVVDAMFTIEHPENVDPKPT